MKGSTRRRRATAACETSACATLAALSGFAAATQSATNLSLSEHISFARGGEVYAARIAAGLISFVGGVGFLGVFNIALCAARSGSADPIEKPTSWHHCLGGVFGSSALMMLLLSNAHIGYATTSVLRLTGNIFAAALFDHIGALGYDRRPVDVRSAALLLVVAAGASLSTLDHCEGPQATPTWRAMALSTLALWAGVSQPVQASLNTKLAVALGAKIRATLVSFFGGALCLLVQLVLLQGRASAPSFDDARPWQFFGGAYGAYIVTMNVSLPPKIGLAASFTLQIVANVAFSCFLDALGFAIAQPRPPTATRLVGVGLALLAAMLLTIRRTAAGRRPAKNTTLPSFRDDDAAPLRRASSSISGAGRVDDADDPSYASTSLAPSSNLNISPASHEDDLDEPSSFRSLASWPSLIDEH